VNNNNNGPMTSGTITNTNNNGPQTGGIVNNNNNGGSTPVTGGVIINKRTPDAHIVEHQMVAAVLHCQALFHTTLGLAVCGLRA
jgi:hypothetical protein